jgi:DNA-binding YbaB/EbfC family protein
MPDMSNLLGMAMEMQQQMLAAQQTAADTIVEGQAGGGAVRIAATGGLEFRSVTIAPELVDPDDIDTLQDVVLAALHDVVTRANDLHAQAASGMGGLGGLDLGGLDLGALGLDGLLGGAPDASLGTGSASDDDEDD